MKPIVSTSAALDQYRELPAELRDRIAKVLWLKSERTLALEAEVKALRAALESLGNLAYLDANKQPRQAREVIQMANDLLDRVKPTYGEPL